jgi:hypothetical protein
MSTKYELKNLATGKTSLMNAVSGTIGPEALDISNLTKEQGIFTFDPGFMATASTESKITYIDGDAGVLLYRGYPVEQLAEKSSFLEVANLLINGSLPSKTQLFAFQNSIMRHTMINEQLAALLSRASTTMPIRWQWCRRWSLRWPRSITTPPTSETRGTARFSRIESSRSCRPSRRRLTSTHSASRSFIRATICATARTC